MILYYNKAQYKYVYMSQLVIKELNEMNLVHNTIIEKYIN